ncbi:MAG TPA: lycopene cyclase domain-containing protein [Gemmataceae bacterium]|nr:lycopene cyclase domain-containing protein [Gemmataceae bacterium]
MSAYTTGYLIGALVNVGAWLVIFLLRKDLRRELVTMSWWAAAIGLPHEYLLWTRDWWHPPTITGTVVGIEDLLYALSTGGLLATLYAVVARRGAQADDIVPCRSARYLPILLDFGIPLVLVPTLGLHSFVASGIGALLALGWILVRRPDLVGTALASAVLGVLLGLPCYWLVEWLMPGFIRAVWDVPRLSGILITGVPIEDLLWYAYSAALFGTYFKYASGARLVCLASAGAEQRGAIKAECKGARATVVLASSELEA